MVLDRGNEFLAEFKNMIEHDYGIKVRPITTRNPQAKDDTPLDGILASTMFALRATVHTTTQHTPAQLVFGRDSVLNVQHEANWQLIKERKQKLINRGNTQENKSRLDHVYKIGDKVLLKNAWKTKFNQDSYLGPYTITAVRDNGTVRARHGIVTDTYNLRNITPYRE